MSINEKLFKRAAKLMPGGVSSPVRAFRSVGGTPVFIKKGKGAYIFDEEGKEYIDFVGSWGPLIAGHANPRIIKKLQEVIEEGTSFGASTIREIELAEIIVNTVSSIEMIRFVNSGTEATMSAIRLARGYTGRKEIVKFNGCYHGHSDGLLVKAGSGATTLGIPDSPGVPDEIAKLTIPAEFNDNEGIKEIFRQRGEKIAAVIVEPVAGNMGVIPPEPGFLQKIQSLCNKSGALFILDEVMTGFRVARGGAQELFGLTPDITCLGKIIGGGLPVGAYGGRKEIMSKVAPLGPVYQAGTLSGNPLAIAAGIEMMKIIAETDFYESLEKKAALFSEILIPEIEKNSWKLCLQRVGSMATLFFTEGPVKNYSDATSANKDAFREFFRFLMNKGIYFPPSPYEAFFVSSAHTEKDILKTIEIILSFSYKYY